MSGKIDNLNPEQSMIMKEFRENLSDVLKPQHDNRFLLRFLRARKFDKNKAEAMLRKNLIWRQRIGADYILRNYQSPEVALKYIPTGLLGFDEEGSSVRLLPQSTMDFKGLVLSIRKLDLIKSLVCTYEYDLLQMKINNQKTGKAAETFVFILDYDGFSLKQVASKAVMDMIFYLLRVFEENYPERLKTAFVINIPPFFSTLFTAVKPFLAEETREKFRFFGKDGWKEEILKTIDANILPAYLGGTRTDSNGDPKCTSLIVPGGTIPQSYYLREQPRLSQHPESVEVSIDYKSVHMVEIHVANANSLLEWEVETEDSDLGVGLLYLSKIYVPGADEELYPAEEILPTEKQTCHLVSEIGSFLCEKPGFYILQLDNSFGKFHQRTVASYRVNVTPLANIEKQYEDAALY